MLMWVSFWSLLLWIVLLLIVIKPKNFISILFISELTWIFLYTLSVLLGAIYCDITLLSTTFFILGVAGLEFSFGIILAIFYKNSNESLTSDNNNKNNLNFFFDKIHQSPIEKKNWY